MSPRESAAQKMAFAGPVEALKRIEEGRALALKLETEALRRGHRHTAAGLAAAAGWLREEAVALVELSL